MNDALVEAVDPKLARIVLKKVANHKSKALEPQLPFGHLVEKIHQEHITRTHIDSQKNSTLSLFINSISMDINNLTVDDLHTMEQKIAYGINVVKHNYSKDPNFKRKATIPQFL